MPTAWVNFLKQRFHLLGVEYNYIGAGRIVLRRALARPSRLWDCLFRQLRSQTTTSRRWDV